MECYVQQALNQYKTCSTPLIETYFSNSNIRYIQNKLKREIYNLTKQHIDEQSTDEIFVIMSYAYSTYMTTVPKNTDKIKFLNNVVLNILIPMVASNVLQYLQYIKDISSLPVPMERAQHTTTKNSFEFQHNNL